MPSEVLFPDELQADVATARHVHLDLALLDVLTSPVLVALVAKATIPLVLPVSSATFERRLGALGASFLKGIIFNY